MTTSSEAHDPERPSEVSRLRDLARYVGLVADQIEALESHDAGRLRDVVEKRQALEEELRPAQDDGPEDDESREEPMRPTLCEELSSIFTEALERLDRVTQESQQERHRWLVLGDDALRALQGSRLRAARGGQYVEFSSTDARVDVRF